MALVEPLNRIDGHVDKPYVYYKEGFWSNIFMLFGKKVVDLGKKPGFSTEDLYPLEPNWEFEAIYPKYQRAYESVINRGGTFTYAFYRAFMTDFWTSIFYWFLSSSTSFLVPFLIKNFVAWMNSNDSQQPSTSGNGWLYAGIIVLTLIFKIITRRWSMLLGFITQFQFGICARAIVYSKFNKISSEAIRNLDIGKLSNLLSGDVWQLQLALRFSQVIVVSPIVLIGVTLYICLEFGAFGLVVPTVFLFITILQVLISRMASLILKKKKSLSDKRAKYISEVIAGIKNIKFQGWEDEVLKKIEEIRSSECALIRKFVFGRSLALQLSDTGPPLALLAFFYSYYKLYGVDLSLADAYLVISLVSQIGTPLRLMTVGIDVLTNANIGLGRLKTVMLSPERIYRPEDTSLPHSSIIFENYSGGWYSSEQSEYFKNNADKVNTLAIQNLNYTFAPGKLYAILGEVGSGKSSMLQAVLDDIITKEGKVEKHGSIAYVSQSAFLLNATIRDNITFFDPFDAERYKRAVFLSCLFDDLQQLPGGDMTEIGERGINLSGGQKQRISIARSIYADKDIYLVDDCLSALDAEVGKKIFHRVFRKALKGKTILLVTHDTSILSDVDDIIVMKGGQIVASGGYEQIRSDPRYLEYYQKETKKENIIDDDLILQKTASYQSAGTDISSRDNLYALQKNISKNSANDFALMSPEEVEAAAKVEEEEYQVQMRMLEEVIIKMTDKKKEELRQKGVLTKEETRKTGLINGKYLWIFITTYGLLLFLLFWLCSGIFIGGKMFVEFWIGAWAKKAYSGLTSSSYCFWLAIIDLVLVVLILVLATLHSAGMITASFKFNHRMTRGILKNKLEFFDATPIGVIVNRFTKDVDILDSSMSFMVAQFVFQFVQVVGILILIMITIPYMIVFVVVLIILIYKFSTKMLKFSSDIRRLILVASSPILSNVSEALNGKILVKSYDKFKEMQESFIKNTQTLGKIEIHERIGQNYVFQSIELIIVTLMFFTLLLIIIMKIFNVAVFSDPNTLALVINWVAISIEIIGFVLFSYQEVNSGINSVERLHDMSIPVKPEASFDEPLPASDSWPATGTIEFDHVSARYRDGLPLVLKDVCLTVVSCEKVGVVGRTGSGKSTLILALKRMIDIADDGDAGGRGRILVDGVDAECIGLKYYRPAIVLIPQDPFLLSGTVRSNIDPYKKYRDHEIAYVLKKTHIFDNLYDTMERVMKKDDLEVNGKPSDQYNKESISSPVLESEAASIKSSIGLSETDDQKIKDVLEFEIAGGGGNISQGQRQLLCIARAIISKPKILLMDEATANIDGKTDQLIQRVIKTEFSGSTVLTIAHRLNTIIQYDRVIVMSNGCIADQGTPLELLEKPSLFKELVMELGEDNFKKMKEYAQDKSLDPILE